MLLFIDVADVRISTALTVQTYFSLLVMLVILVNCVFMAINQEMPIME